MFNLKKFQSIRVQLIFLLSLSAMFGILLYSVVMFIYNFNTGKNKTIESLSQLTSIMGLNLSASVEFDDPQSAEIIMNTLNGSPHIMGAFIFKNKQILFSPYYKQTINKQIQRNIQKKASLLNASYALNGIFEEIDFDSIIIQRNIDIAGESVASFIIISDTNELKQTFFEQLFVQFIVSLVTLLIVVLIANIIQKKFTAPIFKLKDQMEYIASENAYDIRMSRKKKDEFRSLYLGFNRMLNIIQKQQQTVASEIADRKQSEKMAQESKQRLEYITDNIPGVVYQLRVEGKEVEVKFVSQGIKQLQRIEPEDMVSNFTVFIDSIIAEDQQKLIQTLHDSIANNTFLDCEYRVLDSRGQVKWVHMEATITGIAPDYDDVFIYDAETLNNKVSLNGSLVDITSSKLSHDLIVKQQFEIQEIHKHTRESIEYAALIQGALIPSENIFSLYFKDYFTFWQPKDIVGGDIFLFNGLRNENECLLMFIDCTGHGVPGAFVTMLVKAVEAQVITDIMNKPDIDISPAKIMSVFNRSLKKLLAQESVDSTSNAGWDGGIIYYNRKTQILKFAGAETPLFYVDTDGVLHTPYVNIPVAYKI